MQRGEPNTSQELSAEQFTLAKEKEMRARGAEIITAEGTIQSVADSNAPADTAYRPKVATWGVFPRPPNISKKYGGGRTIRPGEVLGLLLLLLPPLVLVPEVSCCVRAHTTTKK